MTDTTRPFADLSMAEIVDKLPKAMLDTFVNTQEICAVMDQVGAEIVWRAGGMTKANPHPGPKGLDRKVMDELKGHDFYIVGFADPDKAMITHCAFRHRPTGFIATTAMSYSSPWQPPKAA